MCRWSGQLTETYVIQEEVLTLLGMDLHEHIHNWLPHVTEALHEQEAQSITEMYQPNV